jgi:hypothetical protein
VQVIDRKRAGDLGGVRHDEHLPALVGDLPYQRRHLGLADGLQRLLGLLEGPDWRWRIRLIG